MKPPPPTTTKHKGYLIELLNDEDLLRYPQLVDFCLSRPVVEAVARYLGTLPILRRVGLWLSFPAPSDGSSRLFHLDPEDLTQVRMFVNIIDISTSQGPLIPQTIATLRATERALVRFDSILGAGNGGRIDSLTASMTELSRSLARSSASLDTVLGRMRRGEGSLGRFATDTSMYVNLSRVLASLDSILVDFKLRPGRYLPTVKVF